MGVEEKRQPRSKRIDFETRKPRCFDVGEAVGDGECQFLRRRGARFTNVITRDGNGVPLRHFRRAIPDHVGHNSHARTGGKDELFLRLIFLEYVVLNRATKAGFRRAVLLGIGHKHRQNWRRRRVNRHGCGGDAKIDAVE